MQCDNGGHFFEEDSLRKISTFYEFFEVFF